MRQTPTSRLADNLLPGGLDRFVQTRRVAGVSWRRIALELYIATDGVIEVSHESVRNWFPDDDNGKEEAA